MKVMDTGMIVEVYLDRMILQTKETILMVVRKIILLTLILWKRKIPLKVRNYHMDILRKKRLKKIVILKTKKLPFWKTSNLLPKIGELVLWVLILTCMMNMIMKIMDLGMTIMISVIQMILMIMMMILINIGDIYIKLKLKSYKIYIYIDIINTIIKKILFMYFNQAS